MTASDAVVRTYPAARRLSSAVILHSQSEQRHRRQHWLSVVYDERFSLRDEVSDMVGPLAEQAAALRYPPAVRGLVAEVADAVHGLFRLVAGMLAESRDAGARGRAVAAVAVLARERSEIPDEAIVDGSWAGVLVDQAAAFTVDLGAFLGGAVRPGQARDLSASERLVSALRLVDGEALRLARVLPRAAAAQARGTVAERNEAARLAREADRARRALARIGVSA